MFSRKDQLIKKTGPDGVGRYDFLKELVNEFHTSKYREGKRQVLANLANFAYDPINFEFLRQLRVLDLFLDQLSANDDEFLEFGLAGLCNLINDPDNQDYIIKLNGIHLISDQVSHNNVEIAANALGTLILLSSPENNVLLSNAVIVSKIERVKTSENTRLRNLANILLQNLSLTVGSTEQNTT